MHLTRIAPTPSGFLHLGNLYNFLLIQEKAREHGLSILLRIDDMDRERVREAYVQDIFDTLHFFGIGYQLGPNNLEDFHLFYSQHHRQPLYNQALEQLKDNALVFACTCSRSELQHTPSSCFCRHLQLPLTTANAAWRLKVSPDAPITLHTETGKQTLPFPSEMREVVVRQKNGRPAYQLSSLVDDVHYGIDFIVRGEDLLPSTLVQLWLAELLNYKGFCSTVFHHHPLVKLSNGEKLSKSAGDTSLQALIKNGLSAEAIRAGLANSVSLG